MKDDIIRFFKGEDPDDDNNNVTIGHYEDLIALLNFKLEELLAHVKLVSNASAFGRDFDITPEDINAYATTLHDKTISAIITAQELQLSLQELDI